VNIKATILGDPEAIASLSEDDLYAVFKQYGFTMTDHPSNRPVTFPLPIRFPLAGNVKLTIENGNAIFTEES